MKQVKNWQLYAFVMASTYRLKVLKNLAGYALSPTLLAERTGIKVSHISRTLKELQEKDLVWLTNPKDRKWKGYLATQKGLDILDMVKKAK